MKPILYKSTEKDFLTNGIGVLSDAISCIVREERNGSYELTMTYPVDGMHFEGIVSRALIMAKANNEDQPQPFRIVHVTKPINGIVEVEATHISYDLSGVAVSPFSASGIAQALLAIKEKSIPNENGFSIESDLNGTSTMKVDVPSSCRSLLGGTRGSLLDLYGGEYKYDRFSVSLLSKRGVDNGFEIRYGENMTDFNQDEDCSEIYTDVYPYWAGSGTSIYLPEKTIRAEGTYDFTRVLPLDMSEYFETAPSESGLREAAKRYMAVNKIGSPKVSLKLSYEDFAEYEKRVALCDTVKVVFPKYNISTSAKIVCAEYDALAERYTSLEIGNTVYGISDTIADQNAEIEKKPSKTLVEKIASNLASAITGANGGSVRLLDTNGDGEPDELYIADNPDPSKAKKVWRFNYEGWAASEKGYDGPYTMGATIAGGIQAWMITAAHLIAGTIASEQGNFFINLDGGTIDTSAEGSTYTNADYTQADLTRINQIITGVVTPVLADYEKLDVNGDGKISITDTVIINMILEGKRTVNFTTNWRLSVNPSDGNNLLKVYRVYHNNTTGEDTENVVLSAGFANVKANSVETTNITATGAVKGGSGDFGSLKVNGQTVTPFEKSIIGYVVYAAGKSGAKASCFIPRGIFGRFQCASDDWYCSFDFDGYGNYSNVSGTGSIRSVESVNNY